MKKKKNNQISTAILTVVLIAMIAFSGSSVAIAGYAHNSSSSGFDRYRDKDRDKDRNKDRDKDDDKDDDKNRDRDRDRDKDWDRDDDDDDYPRWRFRRVIRSCDWWYKDDCRRCRRVRIFLRR
jgi:hypothetical protein